MGRIYVILFRDYKQILPKRKKSFVCECVNERKFAKWQLIYSLSVSHIVIMLLVYWGNRRIYWIGCFLIDILLIFYVIYLSICNAWMREDSLVFHWKGSTLQPIGRSWWSEWGWCREIHFDTIHEVFCQCLVCVVRWFSDCFIGKMRGVFIALILDDFTCLDRFKHRYRKLIR